MMSDRNVRQAEGSAAGGHVQLYTPVKRWQTRIFRLHPGRHGETLSGDLLAADMVRLEGVVLHREQELVQYEALSYSWGYQSPLKTVMVNGIRHRISRPMHEAFRQLRLVNHDRYLWADALCIDQRNDEEKSVQVQNMFMIYRKAKRVLIWLGPHGQHTEGALNSVPDHALLDGNNTLTVDRKNRLIRAFSALLERSPHMGAGLIDVCSRPWATRVWVQQELFAAREAIVFCGDYSMSFAVYQSLARGLIEGDHAPPNVLRRIAHLQHMSPAGEASLRQMEYMRANLETGECRFSSARGHQSVIMRPECALTTAVELEASDTRDRVYAMLGMTTCITAVASPVTASPSVTGERPKASERRATLQIDYTRTASRIFQDVTKYMINRDSSLHILSWHFPRKRLRDGPGLPSWTPDWRSARQHGPSVQGHLSWQDEDDEPALRLKGVVLGVAASSREKPRKATSKDGRPPPRGGKDGYISKQDRSASTVKCHLHWSTVRDLEDHHKAQPNIVHNQDQASAEAGQKPANIPNSFDTQIVTSAHVRRGDVLVYVAESFSSIFVRPHEHAELTGNWRWVGVGYPTSGIGLPTPLSSGTLQAISLESKRRRGTDKPGGLETFVII